MSAYIIPAIAAVLVAVIEAVAARDRARTKQDRERAAAHEQLRAEEALLSMQMSSATLKLSIVTANALTGGHNNGNVEAAKQAAQEAEAAYEAFLQRVSAREVAK